MSNYQSSETFAWSLLVSNTESESEMFSEFGRLVARKNTQVFLHDKPKTSCTRRIFMNEQQPTSPEKSAAVTDVAFHSTHRNGYQSKLLFFHSKGDRCSLWGLLHCDELPAMEHRVIAVMTPSWLVWILTAMPVWLDHSSFLFWPVCFWTQNFIYYDSVSCVWFLLPYVSLQSNRVWKPLKLGVSIWFSLWGFSSLLTWK